MRVLLIFMRKSRKGRSFMRNATQKERMDGMMRRPIPKKKVSIVHLSMVKEGRCLYGMSRFHEPSEAVELVRPLLETADREMLLVMSLNAKLEPMALEIAAVGSLLCCTVDMRDLFKHAILSNAAYILCFHNHPSGDAEASREDQKISRKMAEAGKLLGIRLLDHIIIGDDTFCSLKDRGLLEETEQEVA